MFDSWISWLGFICFSFYFLKIFYRKVVKKVNLEAYKYGTVCITGASDGIGKYLTKEFIKRGFKVLMISRSGEKLEALKSEINSPDLDYIVCDFGYSHRDPVSFYSELYEKIKDRNISVLVNNLGVAKYENFVDNSLDDIENMIGVNIYPQTMLTRLLIPDMIKRFTEQNKRSLLIQFSSIVSRGNTPKADIYSSTKRYNEFFGLGTSYETAFAIDTAVVMPGEVNTNLITQKTPYLPFKANADYFAQSLLDTLCTGINYGTTGHEILGRSLDFLPYVVESFIGKHILPIITP